jgi:hypothetical protein
MRTPLKWSHALAPRLYRARGVLRGHGTIDYEIERMRDRSRIVFVATVDGSTPEPFPSLRAAKASLQSFEPVV